MLNRNKLIKIKENKLLEFNSNLNDKSNESNIAMDIENYEENNELENIDFNYNFNNRQLADKELEKPFEKSESEKENFNKNNFTNININYFSTAEGTIGVIIKLTKEVFEYLYFIQKEIIKNEIGPLKQDYEKWRSIKVKNSLKIIGWLSD